MSLLPRAADPLVTLALDTMRVVIVTGPRQAGKSTLVRHHPRLAGRRYVSLDDLDTLARARTDPRAFVETAGEPMTIDEVQRAPELMLAIKIAVDPPHDRLPGRFVLTGSANLLMMRQVADSLAGRAYYARLWPLTRNEQQGRADDRTWDALLREDVARWPDLLRARDVRPEPWEAFAKRGGFPAPALQLDSDPARTLWFRGYIDTYIERDLRDLTAVDNIGDFRRLMQAVALRAGTLLNQAEVARDLRMTPMTVHRHLNLLETSYQIVRLPPYTINRTKRLIKTPKVYWNDAGLALALSGLPEPTGAHLEHLVLNDLLVWRDSQVERAEVLYWRTTDGREVDFVLETGQRLLPIEVKATTRPAPRDYANLKLFLEDYPRQAPGALLLHGGEEIFWVADRVLAAPWWRVM